MRVGTACVREEGKRRSGSDASMYLLVSVAQSSPLLADSLGRLGKGRLVPQGGLDNIELLFEEERVVAAHASNRRVVILELQAGS